MCDGTSNYIEGMESAGQTQLVNSELLPAESYHWEQLEDMGIVRGAPVENDPLFIHATIPDGWTKQATDHSMHSNLLDERGIPRARIFYKAAFYDRRADIGPIVVGSHLAADSIYGDGELPDKWDVLTDDERASFTDTVNDYASRAAQYPEVWEDYLPNIRKLVKAVTGAL